MAIQLSGFKCSRSEEPLTERIISVLSDGVNHSNQPRMRILAIYQLLAEYMIP